MRSYADSKKEGQQMQQMNVALRKAAVSDRTLIENLLQLYVYDFTEYTAAPIGENGVYQKFWDQIIKEVSYGEVKNKTENGRRYQNFICK